MKSLIFLVSFLLLSVSAAAQVISGSVKDFNSGQSVEYAIIYINGTFIGTQTDKDGFFRLDVSKYPMMPVTISALGYESATVDITDPYAEVVVLLKPKVYELSEVVVNAKERARTRKKHMKIFRDQFLGQTANAKRCRIINEDDIFFRSDTADILYAFSSKPLKVENNGLGYEISYYLDRFKYNEKRKSLIMSGSFIYKESLEGKNKKNSTFEKRRKTAYLGSRMHFIRSLWNNELEESGFNIRDEANRKLSYNNLCVRSADGMSASFKRQPAIYVYYYSKVYGSRIDLTKDNALFEKNGYFDPYGISWMGEMSKQRIADQLPYEYEPPKGKNDK